MLSETDRSEIARMIRHAARPREQVQICMQLYLCSKKEVLECVPEWPTIFESAPRNRRNPYTDKQKLDFCMRYSRGERKELMKEFHITRDGLRKKIASWKLLFPNVQWPEPPVDQFLVEMTRAWYSGGSLYEISQKMGRSTDCARSKLQNFLKNHPYIVSDLEDKRKRREKK